MRLFLEGIRKILLRVIVSYERFYFSKEIRETSYKCDF